MSITRHTPLKRRRGLGVNRKRRAASFERNFGDRAEAVREMDCLCRASARVALMAYPLSACLGDVQACHVIARGMGGAKGDKRDLVPLCARHHEEAGEGSWKPEQPSKRAAFELRYELDLRADAVRIAIELDARGLS